MTTAALLAALLTTGAAGADGGMPSRVAPKCELEGSTAQVRRLADLPPSISSALHRASGRWGMAEAGAPFQKTDVMRPMPMRRFLQAHLVGDTWLVWFEQGGFAYRLGYATVSRQPPSSYVAEVGGPTWHDPCAAARAWLAGDRTSALVRGPRPPRKVRPIPVITRNVGPSGRAADEQRDQEVSPD